MTLLNGRGLVLVALLLLQNAAALPVRFGHMADRIDQADLAQIEALEPLPVSRPWLIVSLGPNFMPEMPWFVEVFLAPLRTTSSVRRGRVMTVKTTAPAGPAYQEPRAWVLDRMAEYAQVPVRRDARVVDGRDLNRPFRIHGAFSDDHIVELARLVRASPPDPTFKGAPGAKGSYVEGTWPIGLVLRRDDGIVEVSLLDPAANKQGQRVTVSRNSGRWTVLRTGFWIAD